MLSIVSGISSRNMKMEFSRPTKSDKKSSIEISNKKRFKKASNYIEARYVRKNLKLRHLGNKHNINTPNSKLQRYLDFVFPIYLTEGTKLHTNMENCNFFINLILIKRIVTIEYNKDALQYNFVINERWPNKQVWKGWANLEKICKILNFQNGNNSAQMLSSALQRFSGYIKNCEKELDMDYYMKEMDESLSSTTHQEVLLPKHIENMIKTQPYLKLSWKIICKDSKGNMTGFSYNDKLKNQLKLDPYINTKYEGFDIFMHLVSEDWASFASRILSFFVSEKISSDLQNYSEVRVTDIDNNDLGYGVKLYKNKYVIDWNIVTELYIVLVDLQKDLYINVK